MPFGKPANTRCLHLDDDMRCAIFHSPARPAVCASLQALREMCFDTREQALVYLIELEAETAP
ncbi:proteinase inhibitor [Yersinia enterocolitica]|nr:proteinase inhibitor [Yersinia enterocolitica]